jgi:putative membrane protein
MLSGEEQPDGAMTSTAAGIDIREEQDFHEKELAQDTPEAPVPAPPRRSWLAVLFWSALGLVVSLAVFDQAVGLIESLAARNPWLGRVAFGLIALALAILAFWLMREIAATLRMRRVEKLRIMLLEARLSPDAAAARLAVRRLTDFYASDATTAEARARLAALEGEILDAATIVDEAERHFMSTKDDAARAEIAAAAQRVSLFTALSPRALVDIVFVLAQSVRLIRRLSEIYGGRASGLGLWRLSLRIGGHVAITGGLGMADQFVGQLVGAGLAARLSAKLGEGVVNGVLTARIGIAAVRLCRPIAFNARPEISLSEVVKLKVIP